MLQNGIVGNILSHDLKLRNDGYDWFGEHLTRQCPCLLTFLMLLFCDHRSVTYSLDSPLGTCVCFFNSLNGHLLTLNINDQCEVLSLKGQHLGPNLLREMADYRFIIGVYECRVLFKCNFGMTVRQYRP